MLHPISAVDLSITCLSTCVLHLVCTCVRNVSVFFDNGCVHFSSLITRCLTHTHTHTSAALTCLQPSFLSKVVVWMSCGKGKVIYLSLGIFSKNPNLSQSLITMNFDLNCLFRDCSKSDTFFHCLSVGCTHHF